MSDSNPLIVKDSKSQQAIDVAAAGFKGILSVLPVIGPVVSEILGVYLPNRRLERVITMLELFAAKIEHLEEGQRNTRMQTEEFADLLEEGVWQAARSVTEERRQHIAALLARSLTDDELSHLQQRRLLDLLGQLNDAEVITLTYYGLNFMSVAQKEFREKHQSILSSPSPILGSSQELIDQSALQRAHRENLIRLGLLEPRFKKPKKGELPEFDEKTGMMKASEYRITRLGRILLRGIQAVENPDPTDAAAPDTA